MVWWSGCGTGALHSGGEFHCCRVLYPRHASLIKYFREMCAFITGTDLLQESKISLRRLMAIRNDIYRGSVPNLLCARPWLPAVELSWLGKHQPASPTS